MEPYPFEQKAELYRTRVSAALPLIHPRPQYASEREAREHFAQQLQTVNFDYGRVDNGDREFKRRVRQTHVKRHVLDMLVKQVVKEPSRCKQPDSTATNSDNSNSFTSEDVHLQRVGFPDTQSVADDEKLTEFNIESKVTPKSTKEALTRLDESLDMRSVMVHHNAALVTHNHNAVAGRDTQAKPPSRQKQQTAKLVRPAVTMPFTSAARESAITTAVRSLKHKKMYSSDVAFTNHISGQLRNNGEHTFPRFIDASDEDVKEAIISGAKDALIKRKLVSITKAKRPGNGCDSDASKNSGSVPQKRRLSSGSSSDRTLQRLKTIAATVQSSASQYDAPYTPQMHPGEQLSTKAGVMRHDHTDTVTTPASVQLVLSPLATSSVLNSPPTAKLASDTVLNCAQFAVVQATPFKGLTSVQLADGKFKCPFPLCEQQSYQLEKACIRHIRYAHGDA